MPKSKLGSYVDILEALVNTPLTIDRIAYDVNMDCMVLRHSLDFLIENSLVEERGSDKNTCYAITEKGVGVLKVLNFPGYLGKISDKIGMIDEALEIIRKLEKSEHGNES